MAKPPAIPAEFAQFWAAYPRRPGDARHLAGVEFAKLLKGGEIAEALIASARLYADHCRAQGIDGRYIPMGRTWLAQRRFEDFPASALAAPSPEGPAGDPALEFLRPLVSAADFASWIAPLRVELRDGDLVVICRTGIALDRVRREWGRRIEGELGPTTWIIERT
ncbi:MAG: hypothetical protein GC145_14525 [Caulobacter sp.]|nr:hypothetical protein [Caulobacter sp.]